ncbi:PilW family protein [Vibrio rotiferianus]|uniref:PilW family protein n=1 Tax=Vibrio rotiferianus TaxID=190895 RepID=UPI00391B2363
MKGKTKNTGFTLIEVLVAGVILFLVVSMTTLIYRGAALSSHKAERSTYINGMLPLLLDDIQLHIREEGQGDINHLTADQTMGQLKYQWEAKVFEYRSAPPKLIAEAGMVEEQENRYKLWQVEIKAEYKGYKREYRYVEFSWNINPR